MNTRTDLFQKYLETVRAKGLTPYPFWIWERIKIWNAKTAAFTRTADAGAATRSESPANGKTAE